MSRWTARIETGFAGLLWAAATILLPMAALSPIDSGGAQAAATTFASSGCFSMALDTLRACPASSL
jgi:hypothetical protein